MTQERKPKLGRPKVAKEEAKAIFISARFSKEEAEQIRLAVKASGKRKSVWIRGALLDNASASLKGK